MSIMQQNVVMSEIFCKYYIKRQPHMRNIIMFDVIGFLYLAVLHLHQNQPVVPYKQILTVTSQTLQLTQTIHLQNKSKTPILKVITLSSSLHTLNISPIYYVSTIGYVKTLVNTIIL